MTPRSSGIDQPRTAGTILAGRYRIVGLLGRGGMGEVYRADDLKLGQPVALKFLPASAATDPVALARFHNEVRVARQVSHPNVCRIYDLSEADGEPFLSMEYVDGEDLASLLRRIGHLPSDKAVQVARQLCAGLSAAHDLGVLHRDLKPANVMLDGRGAVKVTDFGLADFIERIAPHEFAGTPAYMAPEQLTGGSATVKTDLYALGLVLFEMFTGTPAFVAGTAADRARASRDSAPPTPASAQPGIDPTVERVIVRCIDPDPLRRPASARAIAAALPGGDPLAAALAAGETPSPEMVAEAGGVGSLRPMVAWSCFLAIVAGLVAIALLNERVGIHRLVPLKLSPDALNVRARDVLKHAGHTAAPRDTAQGFEYDQSYLAHLQSDGAWAKWQQLARGRPSVLRFWYRESADWLIPWSLSLVPMLMDPPQTAAGDATVVLDPKGQLLQLIVVPPSDSPASSRPAPDWAVMFTDAGLRSQEFTPVSSSRTPPVYADTRAAWTGVFPEDPSLSLRVEAASYAGTPVYFELIGPWPTSSVFGAVFSREGLALVAGVVMILILCAALMARRNIRLGRSDLRSAFRLALFVFLLSAVTFVFGGHHTVSLGELALLLKAAAPQVSFAAVFWLVYVALEPLVRRRWPDLIVSSTRLLAGRLRDPLVGRDMLIGALFGTVGTLVSWAELALAAGLGWPRKLFTPRYITGALSGSGEAISLFTLIQTIAIQDALGVMLLLLILTLLLRRRSLATAAFFIVVSLLLSAASGPGLRLYVTAVEGLLITLVVTRFGILASASNTLVVLVTSWFPITLDLHAFYAVSSFLPITLLLALAWYGLYTSLNGRPLSGWTESDAP